MPKIMRRQKQNAGFSPKVNILTLAAYERARRALRGECEPNSRAGKMRTNISNEPSANIVKMREVCSRPRRLRQNKKRPSQNGLFGRSGGTRTHGLQYPNQKKYVFLALLFTYSPYIPRNRLILHVCSVVSV